MLACACSVHSEFLSCCHVLSPLLLPPPNHVQQSEGVEGREEEGVPGNDFCDPMFSLYSRHLTEWPEACRLRPRPPLAPQPPVPSPHFDLPHICSLCLSETLAVLYWLSSFFSGLAGVSPGTPLPRKSYTSLLLLQRSSLLEGSSAVWSSSLCVTVLAAGPQNPFCLPSSLQLSALAEGRESRCPLMVTGCCN